MKTIFWKLLVVIFLGLAYLGTILPLLPTTIFLILATWAASKGWPEYYEKLLNHPKYGHILRNWREHGTVPRKIKYIAITMMLVSASLLFLLHTPLWVKVISLGSMSIVAIWLWLRPEPKE